jgi:hypothetical protein
LIRAPTDSAFARFDRELHSAVHELAQRRAEVAPLRNAVAIWIDRKSFEFLEIRLESNFSSRPAFWHAA